MICLITGANGFLGKITSRQISLSNIIFGLSRSGDDFNFLLEKQVPNFNIQFDLVIHAAGKAHFNPKTNVDKIEFHLVNVLGTQNLLKGLALAPSLPKSFVFISSVAVYGLEEGVLINENHGLHSKNPFGLSKIHAEKIVQEWCRQYNVVCTILRLPLVVGENPPGSLRAMIRGINKGYYFNVAGGYSKKSMVLAEDVAKYILNVAKVGGIYNLTDGYHPKFAELSEHISKQLGKDKPKSIPIWIVKIFAIFGDLFGNKAPINSYKLNKITSDLTFDDTKAREAFGWNPTSVLEGFKINL